MEPRKGAPRAQGSDQAPGMAPGGDAPAAPAAPSNRQPKKSHEQRLSEVFMRLPLPIAERKFRAGMRRLAGRGRRPGGGGRK